MSYTGDPYADFEARERKHERALAKLPRCAGCGEPIQTERHYRIDEQHYCTDCCEEVYTEDYEDFDD